MLFHSRGNNERNSESISERYFRYCCLDLFYMIIRQFVTYMIMVGGLVSSLLEDPDASQSYFSCIGNNHENSASFLGWGSKEDLGSNSKKGAKSTKVTTVKSKQKSSLGTTTKESNILSTKKGYCICATPRALPPVIMSEELEKIVQTGPTIRVNDSDIHYIPLNQMMTAPPPYMDVPLGTSRVLPAGHPFKNLKQMEMKSYPYAYLRSVNEYSVNPQIRSEYVRKEFPHISHYVNKPTFFLNPSMFEMMKRMEKTLLSYPSKIRYAVATPPPLRMDMFQEPM